MLIFWSVDSPALCGCSLAGVSVKTKIRVLWHEPSNTLATTEIRTDGGLPLLAICDDNYTGINPFYSYPLIFLKSFGWTVLGEL